jgi:nitrogen fixation/metabolism regulation signal transduction histidine kinase
VVSTLYPVRPETPVFISGDHDLLVEVVKSLLANSATAIQDSENDFEEEKWIWLELSSDAERAVLKIMDNGPGVTIMDLKRLNDSHGSSFSHTGGTGFGTRACHRTVGLHGGTIEFLNRGIREGLQVILTFPLAHKNGEAHERA